MLYHVLFTYICISLTGSAMEKDSLLEKKVVFTKKCIYQKQREYSLHEIEKPNSLARIGHTNFFASCHNGTIYFREFGKKNIKSEFWNGQRDTYEIFGTNDNTIAVSAKFGNDGYSMYVISTDKVWRKRVRLFYEKGYNIATMDCGAYSPCGKWIAYILDGDNKCIVSQINANQRDIFVEKNYTFPFQLSVVWNSDGTKLILGGKVETTSAESRQKKNNDIFIYTFTSSYFDSISTIQNNTGIEPSNIQVNCNGVIAFGSMDVGIYDPSVDKECINLYSPGMQRLAFDLQGKYLAVGFWNGDIKIWKLSSKECILQVKTDPYISDLIWSKDGDEIVVARCESNKENIIGYQIE